jgi:hypothetical protein
MASRKRKSEDRFAQLAEFFTSAGPRGWKATEVTFESQERAYKGGGVTWRISHSIHLCSDRLVSFVSFSPSGKSRFRRLSKDRWPELLRFIGLAEKRLKRLGFEGEFELSRFDGMDGRFQKELGSVDEVAGELQRVLRFASLKS